jgi:hypothetical protein
MKNKLVLCSFSFLAAILPLHLQAQGFYAGLNAGYGFPAATSASFGEDMLTTITSSGYTVQHTTRNLSFGTGMSYGLYLGYLFSPHLGAELNVDYLSGHQYILHTETDDGTSSSTTKMDDSWKGSLTRLTPCLRFQVGEKKAKLYLKTGMIIGLSPSVVHEASGTFTAPATSTSSDDVWEYSGGISLGLRTTLGFMYKVSETVNFFSEMTFNYQNWAPQRMLHTKSISNGTDILSRQNPSQAETDFNSTYTDGGFQNPNAYTQADKIYLPFSSWGFTIGVHFFIEKPKDSK